MEHYVTLLKGWTVAYGIKIIAALAIFIIGKWVSKWLTAVLRKMMRRSKVDETLVSFLGSLTYVGLMTFVIIAAVGELGIQTTSFVAIIGAAGLAVGLAFQGSLSNLASGVLLVIFKPFKLGDFVEGGGVMGVVEEIGIFTTVLKTPDNKKIIVPNSKITGGNIVNYSAEDKRRVDLVVGVSYEDNLDKVRRVLQDIIAADNRILEDPAPTIGVAELADSSVNFAVRPWVKTADYWDVFFALNETIKKRFDAEGISIPYPQQDVHLHKSV